MKASFFTTGLGIMAALGLATFAGDASAYTRSVCGSAGTPNNASQWSVGICSITDTSSSPAYIEYSIPIDAGPSTLDGTVWLEGNALNNSCGQLYTLSEDSYYSIGAQWCATGTGAPWNQGVSLTPTGPLALPSSLPAAVARVEQSQNMLVFEVTVSN